MVTNDFVMRWWHDLDSCQQPLVRQTKTPMKHTNITQTLFWVCGCQYQLHRITIWEEIAAHNSCIEVMFHDCAPLSLPWSCPCTGRRAAAWSAACGPPGPWTWTAGTRTSHSRTRTRPGNTASLNVTLTSSMKAFEHLFSLYYHLFVVCPNTSCLSYLYLQIYLLHKFYMHYNALLAKCSLNYALCFINKY